MVLPALLAVCAHMGIAQSACTDWAVLTASSHQTDRSLWYTHSTSCPDSECHQAPADCPGAVVTGHYRIYDGTRGTTRLCRSPDEDDAISQDELRSLDAQATRLNSIEPRTLEDHQRALAIRRLIRSLEK